MSVVIETTLGDITVDLFLEQRPVTCLNFLKLCKMKYYNFNLFHTIRSGFIAQTGDPSGEGNGGQSIFGLLEGPEKRFFSGEKMPKIRHTNTGLLSMVGSNDLMIGSQFFFTLGPDLDSLDGTHCVIGEVTEGHDILRKLNDVICDESHRPYQDVRITHTVVLEDPFNDPTGFRAPSRSPSPSAGRLRGGRIAPDEELDETQGKSAAEIQEMIEEKEAKARATILEIVGDIPDADIAPPENVLFVCKLNPVTTDEDLEIIFSRFGKIVSCEVIRDKKTGDSLQYAFIEFSNKKSCEDAYFKMDNVLIDDRRIHVDFSQSVSKIKWLGKGRGVKHINDDDIPNKDNHFDKHKSNRPRSKERDRNDVRDKHQRNRDRESRRHRDRSHEIDRSRDKPQRDEKVMSRTSRKERSRSRSKREISRERSGKKESNYDNHRKYDSKNTERRRDDHRKNSSYNEEKNKNQDNHTNLHKSRRRSSPVENENARINKSPSRKHRDRSDKSINNESGNKNARELDRNSRSQVTKQKQEGNSRSQVSNLRISEHRNNDKEKIEKHETNPKKTERVEAQYNKSKKTKYEKHIEPRTPSPTERNKDKKFSKSNKQQKEKQELKKKNSVKKKRKPSTSSSDSDSSDSSSSTSSSSSSEPDRKKKRARRRKRKYSSSSSSSTSDSSSSSSTSSSSSGSSSSDSHSNRKRKVKKQSKKKLGKKIKKK